MRCRTGYQGCGIRGAGSRLVPHFPRYAGRPGACELIGAEIMSNGPSQPRKTPREPPYYGPDGRYYPPSDIGELPADELPGHWELPRVGRGFFVNDRPPGLRWYECVGDLMPPEAEGATETAHRQEEEHRRAEVSARLADADRRRAEPLEDKLRELGIDPDRSGAESTPSRALAAGVRT
jgi:hypothetical protein